MMLGCNKEVILDQRRRNIEFQNRVGKLSYRDLVELGLSPSCITGSFYPCDLKALTEFVWNNPEFHIISYLDTGEYVNHFDAQGRMFFLADGDANPALDYRAPPRMVSQAKAMLFQLQDRNFSKS